MEQNKTDTQVADTQKGESINTKEIMGADDTIK